MKTKFRNSELNVNVNTINNGKLRKVLFSAFALMLPLMSVLAQAADVETKIGTWGDGIKTALDAAVLVFAVVGAFLIFIQYMQGNEQAQKNLIRYVIGLAIFGLAELMVGVFI